MFKHFGQGKTSRNKALFNASFVLIMVLTSTLLAIDLSLHAGIISASSLAHTVILLVMSILLLFNHLLLLNNRLLRKVDERLAIISRHSRNLLAIVVLVHVIIICGFVIFTVR
jgi:hypothetical protein